MKTINAFIDTLIIRLFIWYLKRRPVFSRQLLDYLYAHYKKEIKQMKQLEFMENSARFTMGTYDA